MATQVAAHSPWVAGLVWPAGGRATVGALAFTSSKGPVAQPDNSVPGTVITIDLSAIALGAGAFTRPWSTSSALSASNPSRLAVLVG
jgi:hypothetical protein